MKRICFIIMVISFIMAGRAGQCAEASISAGFVDSLKGDVVLVSSSERVTVRENMHFRTGDTIRTGKDSSVGLIFKDDTVVALGANSELVVEDFVFNPAEEELSFITRLIKGSFSFVTGQIGKLAPKKVKVQTPNATLGVRGTKFLVKVD
ncbi:FecR domain-containing protein [Desulfopila sp. IMCC35008]|uniref:FecR family protein n=1 Tax=Desulfopila sp. IMCC35008 TaxID=2653858 RepID=UPI0013D47003|nr:FecR family protein [Desulfopila sp. IMCC35008]